MSQEAKKYTIARIKTTVETISVPVVEFTNTELVDVIQNYSAGVGTEELFKEACAEIERRAKL